jgi:thioredoxin reductase
MRGAVSVHWRDAEYRIRTGIVADGNRAHVKTNLGLVTSDPRVLAVGAVRADYGGNVVQAMAEGVGAAQAVSGIVRS